MQQAIGIFDEEPCSIEHHQHFGGQSFGHRLTSLAGDGFGDLRLLFVQSALELAQYGDPLPDSNLRPASLRRSRARYGRVNLGFTRTLQLAQNFTRRRIHRRNLPRRTDFQISSHIVSYFANVT